MVEYQNIDQFDYREFWKIPAQLKKKGNPGTASKRRYKDVLAAFDIETTTIAGTDQAVMYIWQFHIEGFKTVIGRTWKEFDYFLHRLAAGMAENVQLVVYVHNLSFEFQFLRGVYDFKSEEVFAIDSRKILKCSMFDSFEFRCSYIHSNMALGVFLKKMGAEHCKLSGEAFDYSKQRFSWTALTDEEMEYCVNDVLGLVEALRIEMDHDGDNLYSVPLTSTGYVRRDAKKAMREVSHGFVKSILPDMHTYEMLREAFRGGNTHANRYYAGLTLENVHSVDLSSSYPSIQCNCKFPISVFTSVGYCEADYVDELIHKREKAVLMRVGISKPRMRDMFWGCPYLALAKCRNVVNPLLDNGRILECDYIETTITDIDYGILCEQYEWDEIAFYDVSFARYGYLPDSLISCTIGYYEKKTELKNVEGSELLYMKSKNKLNSIYGMMAQNPVKDSILFEDNEFKLANVPDIELLEESNKKAFLAYQWGVWVTAWARLRLEEGLRIVGHDYVYCDTDSVKYVGEHDFTEFNKQRIAECLESGSYATDPNGETHYMGVYEYEGTYDKFRTLGAKKYCFMKGGRLETTIAGVSKAKGGEELAEQGGIEAFVPGFVFRKAGGTESVYNDQKSYGMFKTCDGGAVEVTANVAIKESTYQLGITADYERLLHIAHNGIVI